MTVQRKRNVNFLLTPTVSHCLTPLNISFADSEVFFLYIYITCYSNEGHLPNWLFIALYNNTGKNVFCFRTSYQSVIHINFHKNWFWSPFHVKVMDSGICIQNTECGYVRWVIHAPEHELLARECFELRDMQQWAVRSPQLEVSRVKVSTYLGCKCSVTW